MRTEQSFRFAVVTCASGDFLPFACLAILSAVQATQSDEIKYIVFSVDANAAALAAARKFFDASPNVEVRPHNQATAHGQHLGRFGSAALTRLELDLLLSPHFSRVIYIDGDVHVNRSLNDLFTADMKGKSIAGCELISIRGHGPKHKRNAVFGMPIDTPCFNAGVLLMDWPKIHETHFLERSRAALKTKFSLPVLDQDALNLAAKGDFLRLDRRWNVAPFLLGITEDPFIVHFIGKIKPWHGKCPYHLLPYRRMMQRSLAGSVWENRVEPMSLKNKALFPIGLIKHFFKNRKGASVAKNVYFISA